MSYKDNQFTNNSTSTPAHAAGVPAQPDEPIMHSAVSLKPDEKKFSFCSPFFFTLCGLSLICFVLFFIFRLSSDFSEFFVRYVSGPVRMVLSAVTSVIPFSLAESIILLLPVGIILFYIRIFTDKSEDSELNFKKYLKILLCTVFILLDVFVITVSPSYHRLPLSNNLAIENQDITPHRLKNTCEIMVNMLNRDAENIYYGSDGQSYSGEDFSALSDEMLECFKKFSKKYSFIFPVGFRAKPVALSEPMTYLHISGVYTYFTGEANVNVNYPDYILPHTVAHEMCHARGVFNEGDANFVGFLVCLESDNPYVRYSGVMSIFSYIANALYSADPEGYFEVMSKLNYNVFEEFDAFSKFFEKYSTSKAAQISGAVNDTFLKANGQSEGIKSYGLVVDLAVNYLEEHYGKSSTQE
ncbi:MAG: DUF3810 domain-containing protein [Ruminococcaceae bacterium]|nr:DUF3810 domain-containing protein [Oscillospiraceae bacterium]